MKKLTGLFLIAFLCFSTADAQVGKRVKKGAKAVGNKTAEVASKGEARVADKKYDGKVGPQGQTIYIDDDGSYYWIDSKGREHPIAASQLRDAVKVKHNDDGSTKVKPH
jgi:hypothetical protein